MINNIKAAATFIAYIAIAAVTIGATCGLGFGLVKLSFKLVAGVFI